MNSRIRKTIFFIVGIAALFVAAVCSVRFGSTNISGGKDPAGDFAAGLVRFCADCHS